MRAWLTSATIEPNGDKNREITRRLRRNARGRKTEELPCYGQNISRSSNDIENRFLGVVALIS
jgi:hypothetical protein